MRIEPSQLLDAAQAVFARDGLERGSVRAIAKEAGCDPSLLYYHFENKEALYSALLDRKFGQLIPDLEKVAESFAAQCRSLASEQGGAQLKETLWQSMMVFHKHLIDDAGFRATVRGSVMGSRGFARDELFRHLSQIKGIICGFLEAGKDSGHLRGDIDPAITMFFFVRLYIEIVETFPMFAKFNQLPPRETIALAEEQWFRLFWAGISDNSKAIGEKP